ncbi:hypothetical protein [Bacillus sp. S3]|nr:hypothetical protein [Bacillus sp. S3]
MRFLTPEEVIAKKEMKKKLVIAGSIISVGFLSGIITFLANIAF